MHSGTKIQHYKDCSVYYILILRNAKADNQWISEIIQLKNN